MRLALALSRTCLPLVGWMIAGPLGCIGTGQPGGSFRGDSASPPPGIDPSRAYLALSQIEPAPSRPERPVSLKPPSERAWKQIAKAQRLVDQQRYTEAAIELERALRYDPNHPEIHSTLAMLHWQAGNLERVKVHVARALEGNPDHATAHYLAGRCAAREGDGGLAIDAYRTALICSDFGHDAENAALVHYHLAKVLAEEGYLEASLAQYTAFAQTADGLEPDATREELVPWLTANRGSAALARSEIFEKLGRFGEAADALAPLVADELGEVTRRLRHAKLLMQARRFDDALAAVRAIPTNEDEVIELLFEIHKRSGHPGRTVDDLRLRRGRQPDDPHLVLALADVLIRLGRADEGRDELRGFMDGHAGAHAIRARLVDLHVNRSLWEEAIRVCAEGILRNPDRTAELESKVTALASNPEAVTRLLQREPGELTAISCYLRGVLAVECGRIEAGEGFLRECYSRKPDFVPGRVALAGLYLRTYRYGEAIQVAARRDKDSPDDARLERSLGEIYERLDNIESAELHFKAAVQLNRTDTQAMLALAKLFRRSGRRLQAQRQLQVLLEKDADHEAARELLAYSYLDEGKRDVAIEQFEQLRHRAKTPTTRARCAALLEQAHKPEPDVQAYRQALLGAVEKHGGDVATWLAIAESYSADSAPVKRREAYRSALAIDGDSDQAAIGMVQTSRQLLEFEEAARQFERLLRKRPSRHSWRLGLSNLRPGLIDYYWWLQDYDAALTVARDAAARDDLDDVWRDRYRLAIVETLRQAGRDQEVIEQLKQWAEAEAERQAWSSLLADEYVRQGQASLAVPIVEAIHESAPDDQDALLTLIDVLVAADRHDRATQYALDLLNDDPDSDAAIWRLATVLADAERTDGALELVRCRLPRTFARERFQNLMIELLRLAERYDECSELVEGLIDEAIGLFRSARDGRAGQPPEERSSETTARLPDEPFTLEGLHGRLTDLRCRLAAVLITAKDYRTAETQLTSWLDSTRNPAERFKYLRRLALCYQLQGSDSRATEALSRALLLKPDEVGLNNDVAYGWIDRGIRLAEAERMIRYALSRQPRQGAYLDTYGWLLYKKGAFAEARKWLLRAGGALADPDPVILDHLGDTCWQLRESEKAVEYWTAAVELVRERSEEELLSEDQRRVRLATPKKIDDARAGRLPAVAPLAAEPSEGDGSQEAGVTDS